MKLRHIHLISNYNFPKLPQFNLDILVEYLVQAPRIVKEQASMNWMFLHCPNDGDVLLVWQPPQMGTREASDGYVWADPESAFSSEMRGYVRIQRSHASVPYMLMPCYAESGDVRAQDRFPFAERTNGNTRSTPITFNTLSKARPQYTSPRPILVDYALLSNGAATPLSVERHPDL